MSLLIVGSWSRYKSCTIPLNEKRTVEGGARAHIMAWDQENNKTHMEIQSHHKPYKGIKHKNLMDRD